MSASMVGLIYKIPFGGMAAKSIAVKLADNSNDDGENIWPAKSSVAKACECSKRTVDRYIDLWLVLGILHLDEHGGGRRKDEERRGEKRRRGRTSVYSFNVPLLQDLRDGKVTIEDLIRKGQEQGVVDSEGRATQESVEHIKGATGAPFVEPEAQEPSDDDTVQQVHPLDDGKGCNRGKERVQPGQGKGAPVAPEPSFNHQGNNTPPTPPRGGGAGEASQNQEDRPKRNRQQTNEIEEMLDRVALIPKRERAVDLILAPLCRQRHFDAPSPEYALGELADWLVDREREITEAEAKRVVKRVLEKRRQNFRQVDVQDAVKALSATPDGSVPINKADDPEACAAWLRYAQQRERTNLAMRTIVYMLAKHDRALVPSRYPPSGAAAK